MNKKLIFPLILMLFLATNIFGYRTNYQTFISIPEYSISCSGFDDDIGKISENYNCYFNYSTIQFENVLESCKLLVMDEDYQKFYFNKTFNNIFKKQKYTGEYVKDLYNFSTQIVIPVRFENEGRHRITFSFIDCKFGSGKNNIQTNVYDIMSTASYYIYSLQKKKRNF